MKAARILPQIRQDSAQESSWANLLRTTSTAPNGIKKLRELILQLGAMGKLVPQSPDDESASELFTRIKIEKERLIKLGKLRKAPPVVEGTLAEQPFALPKSWSWVRLEDVTTFGTMEKADNLTNDTWVLDLEDIEKDTSNLLKKVRFKERSAKSDKNIFLSGDVLYGKLRPYLNKVIVADENGVCTTEILPLRWICDGNPKFLMYALKRPDFLRYVNSKSYGMKMPRLGTEDGKRALIPLAPVNEQKRIVAKVDELMALCDRLEAQEADAAAAHEKLVKALLGTLTQSQTAKEFQENWHRIAQNFDTLFTTESSIDTLKQTILQLAVMGKLVSQSPKEAPAKKFLASIGIRTSLTASPPFNIPDSWEWVRLQDIVDNTRGISYGIIKLGKEPLNNKGIPTLRCSDVKPRYINTTGVRKVSDEIEKPYARTRLHGGEVLLNIRGTLGGVAVVPKEMNGYNIAREVAVIPISNQINPTYLMNVIASPYFWATLLDNVRGLAYKGINLKSLRLFPIPIPPIEEQEKIVDKIGELMVACDNLKNRLANVHTLHEHLATALVEKAVAK